MAGESDDTKGYNKFLQSLMQNPLALVFLIGVFAGGGSANVVDILKPPRPDPYTGTMGEAERAARISGDATLARVFEAESEARRVRDKAVDEKLHELKTSIQACQEYQHNHRVESAQGFARIEQIERQLKEYRYSK